jgi:glycerophosphoryl diester phosphodiesterase
MGTDAVELDVFLLKCGTLVVFHGRGNYGDLDVCCFRPGNIFDLTYEQALELEFNPDYEEFSCPSDSTLKGKIPTLEQVLVDAKKSGLHIKIEFKGENPVDSTLEVAERLDMIAQCTFSCFDLSRIAHLRRLRPNRNVYKTGALFDNIPQDYLQQAEQAGATEIHLRYDTITPQIISAVHEAGFGSMIWMRGPIGMTKDCLENYWDVGNEDESMYDALLRTGVQQMCINKPDVLIGLRNKLNGD